MYIYKVTAVGIFENERGDYFPREGVYVQAASATLALAKASDGYEAFLGGAFLAEDITPTDDRQSAPTTM